jgi:N-acetyl sugar amidotransferase
MSTESVPECVRCLMSKTADQEIKFNLNGLCNHCQRYDKTVKIRVSGVGNQKSELNALIQRIKKDGKGKEYDCLIGVSGGVDSTYVAYIAKSQGLRPLAIHFDNGWNSELAVKNIQNVLKRIDIDLVTYVVNWHEFRDLQLSFLKASVPDGEIPTDHGIDALMWKAACKYNIKYILSGMNFATESISVPTWSYGHSDWKYIRGIHRCYGSIELKTYPHFNFWYLFYANIIRRRRIVSLLNYVNYNKEDAKKTLIDKLGWQDYHGKHFESIYTRFFQGFVLPRKFGIDKRIGHLSDLINSGQITKLKAKEIINRPTYDPALQLQDRTYVIKKLGLTEEQFEKIMDTPTKSFKEFPNSYTIVQMLRTGVNVLRQIKLYPK